MRKNSVTSTGVLNFPWGVKRKGRRMRISSRVDRKKIPTEMTVILPFSPLLRFNPIIPEFLIKMSAGYPGNPACPGNVTSCFP